MIRTLKLILVALTFVLLGCSQPSEYVYLNLNYVSTGHFRGGELRIRINGTQPDFFGNKVSKIAPDAAGATDQAMIQKLIKPGENTIEVDFVPPEPPVTGEPASEAFVYSIAISRVKKGDMVDTSAPGNLYDLQGELKPGEKPKPIRGTFNYEASK